MKILAINVASVGDLFPPDTESTHARVRTAYDKRPVSGPVRANTFGLAGDYQADLGLHGGLRKAVYAYPVEHYAFWRAQRHAALKRDEPLMPGAFGENLTIEGLLERDLWIGDRLQIGSALFSVTEPREPCFKFNVRMGFPHAAKLMIQGGASGFYLSVQKAGVIQAGDAITLLPGSRNISIDMINERRRIGHQPDLF